MDDARDIQELLRRIRLAKHANFQYRARRGIEGWKDPVRCRGRLGISRDDADDIIRQLKETDCYKAEKSINPKNPAKKFFFRCDYDGKTGLIIKLFMKISSPEEYIISVESFHEAEMPEDVFHDEADKYGA